MSKIGFIKMLKNDRLKGFVFSILIITFFIIYSFLRSEVDKTVFIVAFDKVLSTLLIELWKFVSNPIIFIALLVFFVLWIYKDNIVTIFPSIREIKAGSFSATLDFAKPEANINSKVQESNLPIKIDPIDFSQKILLEHIEVKWLKLLLDIDNKIITVNEFTELMQKLEIRFSNLSLAFKNGNPKLIYYFYYGMMITYLQFLVPTLLTQKDIEYARAYFTLNSGIREKIEKILKEKDIL
jgi:hypothetical protein